MTKCSCCGFEVTAKPRSGPDHRRFFAAIRAAANHWPEWHTFQPEGATIEEKANHLRKFLLVKAGHRERQELPLEFAGDQPGLTRLIGVAIKAAMDRGGGYVEVATAPDGGAVAIYSAKSVDYRTLSQTEFGPVRSAVEELIELAVGVSVDDLLKAQDQAA